MPAGAPGREELYTSHLYLHFVTIPEDLTKENLVDVNEELTHWLKTMNYPRNKEDVQVIAGLDPEIAATIERADEFLADERVRDYLLARHKAVTTQATLVATSYKEGHKEGHAEGRAEGIEIGHAEGRAEGIEIGIGQGRAEGIEIGIGQGRAEGIEIGIGQGRAEGIEEGRARARVELAKSRLLKRFGQLNSTIIRRFDEMFENLPNEAECDRIFELALDCASLEEFEASL